MMLTMLAAVLAQALKKKIPYGCIPSDFLFQSDDSGTVFLFINERNAEIFAALCLWNSIPDFSASSFLFHRLLHEADQEIENHLLDIVSEDYSEVKALKDFPWWNTATQ
mgnify:CR=1 FL=1